MTICEWLEGEPATDVTQRCNAPLKMGLGSTPELPSSLVV